MEKYMYCVKCGVELADTEKKCPLCLTPVYYPEAERDQEPLYPKYQQQAEKVSPRGIMFILSFVFAVSALIILICDYRLGDHMSWAGYAVGALSLAYVMLVLPGWFERWHPTVFIPCDFLAICLYLFYVSYATGGGWFFSFALPVCAGTALIIVPLVVLTRYLHHGHLYIWGGALIAIGAFTVLIDILVNAVFLAGGFTLFWSVYPLTVFVLFGLMLIVIAIVKPFKESLKKIFAL